MKNLRKFERKFERADKEQKRARELKQMVHQQRERTDLRERLASRRQRNYVALRAERAAARWVMQGWGRVTGATGASWKRADRGHGGGEATMLFST